MAAKPTPGPWIARRRENGQWGVDGRLDIPDGIVICEVVQSRLGFTSPQDYADARLIAAAPELLAACQSLLMDDYQDEIEDPCGHADRGQWRRINASVLAAAKAAVAKAIGAACVECGDTAEGATK
jgi:hypothetical protein